MHLGAERGPQVPTRARWCPGGIAGPSSADLGAALRSGPGRRWPLPWRARPARS